MSEILSGPDVKIGADLAPGGQPKVDERIGEAVIEPRHSPDTALSPANLIRMVEEGVDIDAVMGHLQRGGDLQDAPLDRAAPAQPRRDDGRFDRQQQDAAQPRREAPAEAATPTAAGWKSTDGKEYTHDQIALALRLADRASSIDRSFEERAETLRQREERIAAQERFAQEGLAARDALTGDPDRLIKYYESTTGRRWPGTAPARPTQRDDYGYQDADQQAADRVGERAETAAARGEVYTREMARADFDRWRTEERAAEDAQRTQKDWWGSIDTFAADATKGVEEFEGIEDSIARDIGQRLGRDIRLGHIVPPDPAKNVRGSNRDDVAKAVKLYSQELLMRERSRLDRLSAKRLEKASEVARGAPNAVRNAASIAPGVTQQARERADVPTNIDDLIAQVTRIADEAEAGVGSMLGG